MANRQAGFGLTREVAAKINSKYSIDDEKTITEWITSLTSETPNGQGRQAFHEWLKNGVILCKLMNVLQCNSCKMHDLSKGSKIPAMRKNKEMENISFFLSAAEKLGVARINLFQTVDLYENQNMAAVQTALFKLGAAAQQSGFKGKCIGVKVADENKRDFDEQKLKEGRKVIGLQMGTNQLASQGGMTPYGLGRQLTPQTK